jgi:hypothetical protein
MSEEMIVYGQHLPATVTEKRGNYELSLPNGFKRTLERNVDFGNPVTKSGKQAFPQPILYKGGAEKIIHDYRVLPRYEIMNAVEDFENGYFFYRFKCSLVAYDQSTGREVVVQEGYGSSNTRETKTGNASGFDTANSALKNARKRSMVDAAISLAGLSSIFTQDMENESFMNAAVEIATAKPEDPITSKQRQRVFAIASMSGMSTEQTKAWLKAEGYVSVKDIKQSDYDALCLRLEALKNGTN